MVCRIKVKLVVRDKEATTSGLINSGFDTDAPDIMIPVELAKRLDLWPPRTSSFIVVSTGSGEASLPYYEGCGFLKIILDDRETRDILVNIIVNPFIREVVLSDFVSSELGIILLDLKKGLWRLRDDPLDKVRESVAVEEW